MTDDTLTLDRRPLHKLSGLRDWLTSRQAFKAIILAGPIWLLGVLIAVYVASVGDDPYGLGASIFGFAAFISGTTTLLGTIFIVCAAVLGGASALYLTLSKRWYLFRRWWKLTTALLKDRFQAVTTDPLVVRYRLGKQIKRGIFLTIAPAIIRLRLPEVTFFYDDDRHVFVVGGSRGGKGVSIIVPNLVHHAGSIITFDPAGENFALTAAHRQQVLGQTVHVLDPFGVTGQPSASWNAMAEIDFDADPRAIDTCFAIAESLIEPTGNDPYWSRSAQELLAMVIAYVGVRSIEEHMHLAQVYRLLQADDLKPLWTAMSHSEEMDGVIARFGESCLTREKELKSVLQTLRTGLRFLNAKSLVDSVSSSSFSMKDLKRGNVSVYLVVPAGAGSTYRGWLRLLFDGAFDAMQDMDIPKPDIPTLFLIDEFPLLGRMDRIKRAAGEAAKFGVRLMLCSQDLNQVKEIYGEAWETFIGNSGLSIFFANNDLTTQTYLSKRLGKEYHTKKTYSSSSTDKGVPSSSTSSTLELRDVARPDQVARQTSRVSGHAYFLTPDMKPMRLARAPFYEHGMIAEGLVYQPADTAEKVALTDTALSTANLNVAKPQEAAE